MVLSGVGGPLTQSHIPLDREALCADNLSFRKDFIKFCLFCPIFKASTFIMLDILYTAFLPQFVPNLQFNTQFSVYHVFTSRLENRVDPN